MDTEKSLPLDVFRISESGDSSLDANLIMLRIASGSKEEYRMDPCLES